MPGSAGTEETASVLPAGGFQSRWGQALAKPSSLVVGCAQCAILGDRERDTVRAEAGGGRSGQE